MPTPMPKLVDGLNATAGKIWQVGAPDLRRHRGAHQRRCRRSGWCHLVGKRVGYGKEAFPPTR